MKKENFYKAIILLLLLLNFGVLGFLWLGHRHNEGPMHGPPPDRIIVDRLKLDEGQQDQFERLKHEHHELMMQIEKESANLHRQWFDLLKKEPIDTVAKKNLLLKMQDNYRSKEIVTFEHFQKLRGILRPDQKPLFDNFVQELSRQLMGPPPPPRQ